MISVTRAGAVWSWDYRGRQWRYPNIGKVQVGKALLGKEPGSAGREEGSKGICFVHCIICELCQLTGSQQCWASLSLDSKSHHPSCPMLPPSSGPALRASPVSHLNPTALPRCLFSCSNTGGDAFLSLQKESPSSIKYSYVCQCQALSERELLLINEKGKLIVIWYKRQGGNPRKIKHCFSTRRKGRFPW